MASEATSETPHYDELNDQWKLFVDAYVGLHGTSYRFSAIRSYIFAGFAEHTAKKNAWRFKAIYGVTEAIRERLSQFAMRDEEAAAIIASHAGGTMRPFVRRGLDGRFYLDPSTDDFEEHLHLVREWDQEEHVIKSVGEEEEEMRLVSIKTKIKLYDAQSAAHKIRQAHGAYGATGKKGDPVHIQYDGVNFGDGDDDA